jgi:hypothetical protein
VVEKKSLPAVLATRREDGPAARIADPPTRFAGDDDAKQSEVGDVVTLLEAVAGALFAALRPRASLVIENLALRQQLSILRRPGRDLDFGRSIAPSGSCSAGLGRVGRTPWRS